MAGWGHSCWAPDTALPSGSPRPKQQRRVSFTCLNAVPLFTERPWLVDSYSKWLQRLKVRRGALLCLRGTWHGVGGAVGPDGGGQGSGQGAASGTGSARRGLSVPAKSMTATVPVPHLPFHSGHLAAQPASVLKSLGHH